MITITRTGQPDRHSKNLRGILDYARRSPVELVRLSLVFGEARLFIRYADGAECATTFADWRVLRDWIASRRSWSAFVVDELPAR